MTGQMYVEYQIPSEVRGAVSDRDDPRRLPDRHQFHRHAGRPRGWAQYFLRRGWPVYVVDTVGRGRSTGNAETYGEMRGGDLGFAQARFVGAEAVHAVAAGSAALAVSGRRQPGDAIFDEFFASQVSSIADFPKQQALNAAAGAALSTGSGARCCLRIRRRERSAG